MAKAKGKEAYKAVAKAIKRGETIQGAMLQAGFSESMARQGMHAIRRSKGLTNALVEEMGKDARELIEIGRKFSPSERADLIRGAVIKGMIEGSDKGMAAAKLAGSDRAVNLWQPEVQVGIFALNAPQEWNGAVTLEGNEPKALPEE